MLRIATVVLLLSLPAISQAQSVPTKLADLSPEEYGALERANLDSVSATVQFLSSDELAGRKSLTPEFRIAAAYVASRLRAAGAEGLGPDGSFYVESEVATLHVPAKGTQASQTGSSLTSQNLGPQLLNGSETLLEFSGKLQVIESASQKPPTSGVPVGLRLANDQPSGESTAAVTTLQTLVRMSHQIKRQGASALVLLAPVGHPAWAIALDVQSSVRLAKQRGGFALPTLIVASELYSPSSDIDLVIAANIQQTERMRNVSAVIRGSDETLAKQAVLYSAHLDHLGDEGTGEDKIYNGADDDASGVTAVLTLADCFGALETKPARSVIFTTFWGEEMGLLGSTDFAANCPWSLTDIVANVNIEMIGRPAEGAEHKMWMTGWNKSDLGTQIAQGSRRVGVETFEHSQFSAMLYQRSDNYALAKKGVVAHSFSAGSLHDDYHQVSDEWTKLNLPHMTQIIRGIYAGTLPIAQGQLTPTGASN